jgi:hypothetical protein
VCGCSRYTFNGAAFQEEVARGSYEEALRRLEPLGDEDVAVLLDRALCLQALGRLEESDEAFEAAIHLTDDLYTKSLSKEGLSLLTSDLARDYRAAAFEQAVVAYFRSWNYLERGSVEGVLVEARRINERLSFIATSCPEEGGACAHDPFLRYWSGLLFEWGGEINDAYVSYKLADDAAATVRERFGVEPPPDLGRRLVRLADRLGFRDEAAHHAEAHGVDPAGAQSSGSSAVLVLENGLVGRREETGIFLPIFKSDSKEAMVLDTDGWSETLAGRAYQPYDGAELDYLLRVALPTFVATPPQATGAVLTVGGNRAETTLASPLSERARRALEEVMPAVLVRATARALLKYLAKEAAEDELGEGAGFLVNLFGLATERADTRSWRTLPYEIQLAVVEVPPGTYVGEVTVQGAGGSTLDAFTVPEVRVPARGGVAFIRHRAVP